MALKRVSGELTCGGFCCCSLELATRSADGVNALRRKTLDLMMIEQPLRHDDLLEHARLQECLKTPICLDESIRSYYDAKAALTLGSCRIINIKLGRVGGFASAKRIHDLCLAQGVPVWCGGMLETGIGRAHNIALSSLPGFTIPGDVSASRRYYRKDTTTRAVEASVEGQIEVPLGPGTGYDPDVPFIESATVRKKVLGHQTTCTGPGRGRQASPKC
ncbi:MAG: hypothetical protein HY315_01465 [Acidobacteria bacterium]|nr:hypothetical protein [Acidobacteriota bacterium]